MPAPALALDALSRRAARPRWIAFGLALAGVLTLLLLAEVLPYAWQADAMPFFLEKGSVAREAGWRAAFAVHVTGGVLCLVTALALFSRRLLAARPGLHRVLGWSYVAAVLLALVPGGAVLIPAAKGGFVGQAGFTLQAGWLLVTTLAGLRRVLACDFVRHRVWMVRSYAMAASALSFRVIFLAFQAAELARAYEMAVWASFGLSVVLGEAWIQTLSPRRRT